MEGRGREVKNDLEGSRCHIGAIRYNNATAFCSKSYSSGETADQLAASVRRVQHSAFSSVREHQQLKSRRKSKVSPLKLAVISTGLGL